MPAAVINPLLKVSHKMKRDFTKAVSSLILIFMFGERERVGMVVVFQKLG